MTFVVKGVPNLIMTMLKLKILLFVNFIALLSACMGIAPVQEMSNARQTLQTAKAAKADVYAQDKFARAQDFLEAAANQLNSGDFYQARKLALQATHEAKQAHLAALNYQKK